MKIIVFIPTWKRAKITELCFMGIERLRKKYPLDPFIIVSDSENYALAKKYKYKHLWHENFPLGRKKNNGLIESLKYDYDYLLELNSDGLITDDVMSLYIEEMKKGTEVIGVRSVWFVDSKNKKARFFRYGQGQLIGSGRAYKRSVIEKVVNSKDKFWSDMRNKGLDNNSMNCIRRYGFNWVQLNAGVIDVKSNTNIWDYNHFRIVPDKDIDHVTSNISKKEAKYIMSL